MTEWEPYSEHEVSFDVSDEAGRVWGTDEYIVTVERRAEEYEGPYSFVPGETEQAAHTQDKLATGDIVIQPIPDNYGRIAYSGAGLLVY